MLYWRIKIANRVTKSIVKFPSKDAKRLLFVLESLSQNPYQGDIEKLRGEEYLWRRRVGSYPVLCDIFPKEKFVSVFDIRRRTSKTY